MYPAMPALRKRTVRAAGPIHGHPCLVAGRNLVDYQHQKVPSRRSPVSSVHPKEPWHTDQWFTTPWNHDPEVAASFESAEKITVHDVTLRDGQQQAGVEFTADDKVRIAEALSEAGVHRIEAGLPAAGARQRQRDRPHHRGLGAHRDHSDPRGEPRDSPARQGALTRAQGAARRRRPQADRRLRGLRHVAVGSLGGAA
jgi:hypothetical protein